MRSCVEQLLRAEDARESVHGPGQDGGEGVGASLTATVIRVRTAVKGWERP